MLKIDKKTDIIFHFNKMHLQDTNIPMWVIKVKGKTYYVDHVNVDSGIGFSTKETPDNPSTKGSIKFKGKLEISDNIARIYP
jgi:hypothetical protein